MKKLWKIGLFVCLCSCKNTNGQEVRYTQQENIQLASPRIEAKNVILDTSSRIIASLRLNEAEIYYTDDGSEPTQTSQKYNSTISVSNPGTYTFKAFHSDFKPSDVKAISFYAKGIDISNISLLTPLSKQYPGQGKNTLVNHKKGTSNFKDDQWIGIVEPLVTIVDFKDKVFLESIDIGYLVNTSAWIFPIEDVIISFSQDGVNFIEFETDEPIEKLNKDVSKLDNLHISILKEMKKIKIEIQNVKSIPKWHQGKGNPAWLFMDEWIFNTRNNK
ncbi:chitobiase/beta-hexosaminidase C-terminal domain-containing protein [Aquimarina macrocephali]|uniref:chitobiase/beta-hexosaminidase C-terminal domain-containing protein n=1 Tax=Aquimarina macrocephali TaxID=666563 RepID=UPI000463264E|nr:chitobiase/beta-hexosaminidase C-terminal domain-containing protein [Aquimarina macrocephali]